VFSGVSDPIGSGFIESLARPGGNITGFTNFMPTMGAKWLEVLKEIAPHVKRVVFMWNPQTAPYVATYYLPQFEAAAPSFAVEPSTATVRDTSEIEGIMTALGNKPESGLIVPPDIFTQVHRNQIITLAARTRVAAIYTFRFWAADGGLASYGVDLGETFPRAAEYIDRILKGTTPADLPVQAPTKFELVINLKTAKAMGLTIPESFLARADEVIE
jgi:putative ABC transport system substrate-binding protein